MAYTKVKTKEEFLRAGKQALRAVHALALCLSGLLRLAFTKERLPEEDVDIRIILV